MESNEKRRKFRSDRFSETVWNSLLLSIGWQLHVALKPKKPTLKSLMVERRIYKTR